MARKAPNTRADSAQPFPAYSVDEPNADLAYDAYASLRVLACQRPWLLDNPYFKALQDTAYARFLCTFEAM